ncbi:4-hydroxy-3-methylbut-2-enyl diphosphate reductase [Besnoitia besnoiti]|uniref:4-hydroxy-3-methylbut-2-enyl diphosphate reductase n=1 Tax=Besnoitia besnoiti TaxID=94643 RepID=A0A2A9MAN7_BESBE|nr:4-hydroxy-3-methylbut-2-enyl diphosphate reductase [Besnoitia besnoiti]PFH35045.1 4-hydroxy-3-methylbut-2-enyl diphosphate reductase [Besnoitia besnoiti]
MKAFTKQTATSLRAPALEQAPAQTQETLLSESASPRRRVQDAEGPSRRVRAEVASESPRSISVASLERCQPSEVVSGCFSPSLSPSSSLRLPAAASGSRGALAAACVRSAPRPRPVHLSLFGFSSFMILFCLSAHAMRVVLHGDAIVPSFSKGGPSAPFVLDRPSVSRSLSPSSPSSSSASPPTSVPAASVYFLAASNASVSAPSAAHAPSSVRSPFCTLGSDPADAAPSARGRWRGSREAALHTSPLCFAVAPSTSLAADDSEQRLSPPRLSSASPAVGLSSPSPAAPRGSLETRLSAASPPAAPEALASSPDAGSQQRAGIELLLSKPRGFCAGVSRAIGIVEEALRIWGPPVYVKHSIVHNEVVCDAMRKKGAVFVEEISEIPPGAVAVFSAHGVSPAVRAEAEARGLRVVDATCPLVTKVHVYVKQKAEQGYHIVLIGHKNHVEVIGTKGEAPGAVTVVESVADVEELSFPPTQKLFYATQTTLSLDDCAAIRKALVEKYPHIESIPSGSICYATTNRQTALQRLAPETDLTIVVGSEASSNANRLVETAKNRGTEAYLVNDPSAIDPRWLENVSRVSLTSSASTPETTTAAIVERLRKLGVSVVSEREEILERVPMWKFPKNLQEAAKKKLEEENQKTDQEAPVCSDV